MTDEVRIPLAAVPTDRCVAVADGRAVVVRVGDRVVAFANRCCHRALPLEGGRVVEGALTCPQHFWRYDLPGGEHRGGHERLTAHPARVEGDEVVVELPDPAPALGLRERLLAHAREWERG